MYTNTHTFLQIKIPDSSRNWRALLLPLWDMSEEKENHVCGINRKSGKQKQCMQAEELVGWKGEDEREARRVSKDWVS